MRHRWLTHCVRGAVLATAVVSSVPLAAQRPARGAGSARPGTSVVRAEFASVLLQAGRYDEAAREYRALLLRDPESFDYRLGLARALAWGERHREAEAELTRLATRRPGSTEVSQLLRSVRASLEPRAVEAAAWVAAEPLYQPYRLSLARALARERMPRLAIAHYDTLLLRGGVSGTDQPALVREMVDAFVAAGDRTGAEAALRRSLQLGPADTALRHALATLFAGGRRFAAARAQYDSLIAVAPTAVLFVERARVRVALGDRPGAEADLSAALDIGPTAEAYLVLGTLYRERGDYRAARAMFDAARARNDPPLGLALAEARAQLAREERPVAAFAATFGSDPGWQLAEDAAADNLGVAYSALAVTRSIAIGASTEVLVGAEYRQIVERANGRSTAASGQGGSIGLSHELAVGWVLARAEVAGKLLYHPLVGTIPEGHAGVGAWLGPWQLAAEAASGAAYPTLFTTASLLRPDSGDPIIERGITFTLGGPVGKLDAAALWQQSRFSDGNTRLEMQGLVRYPVAPALFVVYAGSAVRYAKRSMLYWDPDRYTSHGAGIEYARRRLRGLSVAVRALPAFASSVEAQALPGAPALGVAPARGPLEQRTAVQLSGSGDVSFRAARWELAGALSYGRGRAGDYQRYGASIMLRLAP